LRRAVAFHAMNLNASPWVCSRSSRSSPQAAPHPVLADLLVERAADRADRRAAQPHAAREHLDRDRVRKEGLDVEQAECVAERQRRAVQHVIAGGQRLDRRGDLDLLAAAHGRARPLVDRQPGRREDVRRQDSQLATAVVAKREVQLERAIRAERAARLIAGRHPPRQLDLLAAEQDRRRIEHQVEREQHREDRSREANERWRAVERTDEQEQQRRAEHVLPACGEARDHARFGIL
jgi:hypothetical protein